MAAWWDASELRKLADDLGRAPADLAVSVRQIMAKAGVNMKRQLRDEMKASPHFKRAAHRISYSIETPAPDRIVVEVGPSHGEGDPGSLANIAYFGTSRGGGTVADPLGALEAEAVRTEEYLAKLAGGLL